MRWQKNTWFDQLPALVQQASISDACCNWPGKPDKKGYGAIKHQGRMYRVPRLSLQLSLGRQLTHAEKVCHSCDNPACFNPRHLFIGSDQDNMSDKTRKGRQAKGEQMPASKLTEQDVWNILALLKAGSTQKEVAALYGVGSNTINHINTGFTWGWLTGRKAHNVRRKDPTLK